MKKYQAKFEGRKIGSIGITYRINTTVEGNTEEEARLNLYEHYEHITKLILKEIKQ